MRKGKKCHCKHKRRTVKRGKGRFKSIKKFVGKHAMDYLKKHGKAHLDDLVSYGRRKVSKAAAKKGIKL